MVRSDSGSQYTSAEFQNFAKTWNFEHSASSPYHQQSNGLLEKYVNIAKNLLDKAKADEKDPYIALLDYRNTSINDVSSPAHEQTT
jgi:transposase InsO family protein